MDPADTSSIVRRDFIKLLTGAWTLITAAPLLAGVLKYLTPREPNRSAGRSLTIGSVRDIPAGQAKVVRFEKEPVILVHTKAGQFKAFSARCTHLGCVVQYVPEPPHFECHCHGSVFTEDGKNVSGPAPRPLPPFKLRITENSIVATKA